MAIEDAGGQALGKKVNLLVADDQNKPDIGLALARKWIDEDNVRGIVGCSASSIALGVQKLMADRKQPYMLAGTASSSLTNDACSPYGTQWVLDTYSLPKANAKALVAAGKDTWYLHHRRLHFRQAMAGRHDQIRRGSRRQGRRLGRCIR